MDDGDRLARADRGLDLGKTRHDGTGLPRMPECPERRGRQALAECARPDPARTSTFRRKAEQTVAAALLRPRRSAFAVTQHAATRQPMPEIGDPAPSGSRTNNQLLHRPNLAGDDAHPLDRLVLARQTPAPPSGSYASAAAGASAGVLTRLGARFGGQKVRLGDPAGFEPSRHDHLFGSPVVRHSKPSSDPA